MALGHGKQKVIGSTIAELGNRNRPIDMLIYSKQDKDYLLITNSSRGVMKLAMASVPDLESLTDRVADTAGLDIEQIEDLKGTLQVEAWGDSQAVTLKKAGNGAIDLTTIALP